jgi:hypothetical protein
MLKRGEQRARQHARLRGSLGQTGLEQEIVGGVVSPVNETG